MSQVNNWFHSAAIHIETLNEQRNNKRTKSVNMMVQIMQIDQLPDDILRYISTFLFWNITSDQYKLKIKHLKKQLVRYEYSDLYVTTRGVICYIHLHFRDYSCMFPVIYICCQCGNFSEDDCVPPHRQTLKVMCNCIH